MILRVGFDCVILLWYGAAIMGSCFKMKLFLNNFVFVPRYSVLGITKQTIVCLLFFSSKIMTILVKDEFDTEY